MKDSMMTLAEKIRNRVPIDLKETKDESVMRAYFDQDKDTVSLSKNLMLNILFHLGIAP